MSQTVDIDGAPVEVEVGGTDCGQHMSGFDKSGDIRVMGSISGIHQLPEFQ